MLTPNGARVLVKRLDAPQPVSELIIIPDMIGATPSSFALVIAVGKLLQGGISPGDVVVLKDYSGAPVSVDLEGDSAPFECSIVVEDDVLAVVEGLNL